MPTREEAMRADIARIERMRGATEVEAAARAARITEERIARERAAAAAARQRARVEAARRVAPVPVTPPEEMVEAVAEARKEPGARIIAPPPPVARVVPSDRGAFERRMEEALVTARETGRAVTREEQIETLRRRREEREFKEWGKEYDPLEEERLREAETKEWAEEKQWRGQIEEKGMWPKSEGPDLKSARIALETVTAQAPDIGAPGYGEWHRETYIPAWEAYATYFQRRHGMTPSVYAQRYEAMQPVFERYYKEAAEAEAATAAYQEYIAPIAITPAEAGAGAIGERQYYARIYRKLGTLEDRGPYLGKIYKYARQARYGAPEPTFGAETYRAVTRFEEERRAGVLTPGLAALGHIGARGIGTFETFTGWLGEITGTAPGGRPAREPPPTILSPFLGVAPAEMETPAIKRFITGAAAGAVYLPLEMKVFTTPTRVAARGIRTGVMAAARAPLKGLARFAPPAVKAELYGRTTLAGRFAGVAPPTKLVSPLVPTTAERFELVRGIGKYAEDIRVVRETFIGPGPRFMGRTPFRQMYRVFRKIPGAPAKLEYQMMAPKPRVVAGVPGLRFVGRGVPAKIKPTLTYEPSRIFGVPMGREFRGMRLMAQARRGITRVPRTKPMTVKGLPGLPRSKMLTVPSRDTFTQRYASFLEKKTYEPALYRQRVPIGFETMPRKAPTYFFKRGDVFVYEKIIPTRRGVVRMFGGAGVPPYEDPFELAAGMRIRRVPAPMPREAGVAVHPGPPGPTPLYQALYGRRPPISTGELGRIYTGTARPQRLMQVLAPEQAMWVEVAPMEVSGVLMGVGAATALGVAVGTQLTSAQRQRLAQRQKLKQVQRLQAGVGVASILSSKSAAATATALGVAQMTAVAQAQVQAQEQIQKLEQVQQLKIDMPFKPFAVERKRRRGPRKRRKVRRVYRERFFPAKITVGLPRMGRVTLGKRARKPKRKGKRRKKK